MKNFTNNLIISIVALIVTVIINKILLQNEAGAIGIIGKVDVSTVRFLVIKYFSAILKFIVVFAVVLVLLILFRRFMGW